MCRHELRQNDGKREGTYNDWHMASKRDKESKATVILYIIPMYTGSNRNLTRALDSLKNLRDEHVRNTVGHSNSGSWWDWLFSSSWKATLLRLGTVFLQTIVILMVLTCCVVPLIQLMSKRMLDSLAEQHVLVPKQDSEKGVTDDNICKMADIQKPVWMVLS